MSNPPVVNRMTVEEARAVIRNADIEEAREIIRNDWVTTSTGRLLHHIDTANLDPDDIMSMRFENVTATCGRVLKWAVVPGVFTRMGAKRCGACCDRMDYPRGKGSPKNDDGCRVILGLDAFRNTTKSRPHPEG